MEQTRSGALASSAQAQGITNTRALAFGELVAGVTSGTAIVTPAGARTLTGGVTPGGSGGVTSASFTVSGIPLFTYSISLLGSAVLTAGPNTMTVNTFTSNPSGTGQLQLIIGTQILTVGATLQVGASQSSGSYTGTQRDRRAQLSSGGATGLVPSAGSFLLTSPPYPPRRGA